MSSRSATDITDWFRTTAEIAMGRSTGKPSMKQWRRSLLSISAALAVVTGVGSLLLLAYGSNPYVAGALLVMSTAVLLLDASAQGRHQ